MPIKNILPVKEGSDISIYNILEYNSYKMGGSRNAPNSLFIVWRDKEGKKHVQHIKNPKMEIYYVKPEYRTFLTPREYIEMDKVIPVTISGNNTNVIKHITATLYQSNDVVAQAIIKDLNEAQATGNFSLKKQVHKWPYVLMSDLDLETYYWIQLGYHYNTMHGHVIDKCFADIENDVYGMTSAETNKNLDPVNACTLIF